MPHTDEPLDAAFTAQIHRRRFLELTGSRARARLPRTRLELEPLGDALADAAIPDT